MLLTFTQPEKSMKVKPTTTFDVEVRRLGLRIEIKINFFKVDIYLNQRGIITS